MRRTQVNMAAILPAQLMIGIDIRNASSVLRATLLNNEVIKVQQQDPAALPGRQWLTVGSGATNAQATSPSLVPCNSSDDSQQFVLNATGYPEGTIKSLVAGQVTPGGGDNGGGCLFVFGGVALPGGSVVMWPCLKSTSPPNTKWQFDATTGWIRSLAPPSPLSQCLTAPSLTIEPCGRGAGQQWRYDTSSHALQLVNGTNKQCLTAKHGQGAASTNHDYRVWGRALADGSVAVVAVNHGQVPTTIVCDGACFAQSNFSATEELLIRDLWTHQELGSVVTGTLIFENVSAGSSSVVLTLRRHKTDDDARGPATKQIDMWWKPQSSSTIASDVASMRELFSITGVIIYCGLAVLDNGTVGWNARGTGSPTSHEWGRPELCPAAIAAAGSAGLQIQIILEGRVTAGVCGIERAYKRGGGAVGAEAMRLVQSMDSQRRVTGINIDFEKTKFGKWSPAKAATDVFTASFADAIRPGKLVLTLCTPGLAASPLAHGITEVFEMAEYSAAGGKAGLANATNWQWKLNFDLNEFQMNTSAFVVGLMPSEHETRWENTTESVSRKFALMKQRGIRKVAVFCWPGAQDLWTGLLDEWQAQLKAFISDTGANDDGAPQGATSTPTLVAHGASDLAFHPGQPIFDTAGVQIDAHGGGFLLDGDTYYWFGSARLNHTDDACTKLPKHPCDKGINLYSSKDLYSWTFESLVVAALTSSDNGLDLERPKVVQCGVGRYVMWLRGTPVYNGTDLKVGMLTAPHPTGPWSWVVHQGKTQADPFVLVGSKYQYGDATLWADPATDRKFVYWRARTTTDGFRAMQLDSACTGVVPGSDTRIFRSPNREAPAFFSHKGSFYLWASGTLGWTPVQGHVYRGPTPLGPFNQSLGHGWHAHIKPADFNTSHSWTMRDGYLPAGHDWRNATETTLPAAQALCAGSDACRGFAFKAYDPSPPANESIRCYFKTRPTFVPEGDPEGQQPPPIAEPGEQGNSKEDGQPGILSYGSQSTYILPNPKFTPGSRLAAFIYMADQWQPNTPTFGLYVWLPLFVDEQNGRVSVPWLDAWTLENATTPSTTPTPTQLKADDASAVRVVTAVAPLPQQTVHGGAACFGPLPPELLGPPVPPPPATDWTRSASILQPWGPTQFELIRNATWLAPLLASAYRFSAIILLPAPAHLSYCAVDGPCALTAGEIAAGAAAFRAAGWRVIMYTSFMHVGEARSWTNGSVNREHPDWAQRNGSGAAWRFEGSNSPLSPCSEGVLEYTTHYASQQAAAMQGPDATMLDNNELGPIAWGCPNSGCGYEPSCAAAFDTYVRSRFNASTLRSCFGVDDPTQPVAPPPRSALGTPLYGLWVHWRSVAMASLNRRFRRQLGAGGQARLLANTAIDWPDFSLGQDLQYVAEDVVLSEVYDSDPMRLHGTLSLGVGMAQGRPFWAALYQNQMRAVELDPKTLRRLLTFSAAHQTAPWLVFESVLLNSSDARSVALKATAGWLARETAALQGGSLQAPVACIASAATRSSAWHNQSAGVAITPTHCLALAAELGAPVRVVYDHDYRDSFLEGVSLLVLDGVRCLPQGAQQRIVAWAQTAGRMVLASDDSGQCDGLGRVLPSRLTLFSQIDGSAHSALTRADINSRSARSLVASHSWLLASLAADGDWPTGRLIQRWIVLPYFHPKHVTIFVLCGELRDCGLENGAAPRNTTLSITLNGSQHATSARLTAVDGGQPLAFKGSARTGQVMVLIEQRSDDYAVVVTIADMATAPSALKADDESQSAQSHSAKMSGPAGAVPQVPVTHPPWNFSALARSGEDCTTPTPTQLKADDASAVRVVTGDGALALELGATTGAITALELGGMGVAPPLPQQDRGGFALSEHLGSPVCKPGAPPATTSNMSLLGNGNFTQPGAHPTPHDLDPSRVALGWAAWGVGYRRVTGANVTRSGHAAAIQANTSTAGVTAGASRVVTFAPAMTSMFQTVVLSGWSKAEADATGTSKQALDYSVYADVGYADGTFSFGEAAVFRTGAHDWEYSSHAFRVAKPLKLVHVYAMYRNRIGKVWFSDLALTGVPHAACMPQANGTAQPTVATGNWSAASISSKVSPPSWNGSEAAVTATFEGLADHIRITGAVALTRPRPCPYPNPCPPDDAPPDRAVSLQLAFPLAGAGWRLWSDAETFVVLPSAGNTSHMFGGLSEKVATLPNTIDRYPMLVLTSPNSTQGIMLAIPMVPIVYVYRIQYDSQRQMLQITFDFGLTSRTQRYPSMATFECLLMPLAQPAWGFRAGLQSYFSLFPEAFRPKNLIRDQGIWLASPEVDVASIPDWQDFGLKFAEEMNEWNVSQSQWMNKNGVMIFPYVEPSNMHWCLAGVKTATWENVHSGITNCSKDPTCGNQANALAIVNDVVVGADGKWIWAQCCAACGANAAIFMFSGLEPETLNDPNSWASYILARLNAAYDKSVEESYQIAGMYMDGMVAFSSEFTHINYRESALLAAMHPPIYDSSGRIAVLSTQGLLAFMNVLAKTLHSRGQHLMGNGQYCQGAPNFMFPAVFDVAGTESDWQSGGTPGKCRSPAWHCDFDPPPAVDLLFARAMSGAKPYLHLLDTHLATWTKESTNQYFQICLLYGIWPSFEEDNTSEAPGYFSNPKLYERDRPVFKQFVPVLQKINYAGWQPLQFANASNAAESVHRFNIERWGSAADGVVYWTLRRVEPLRMIVTNLRPVRLTLHTADLGLVPRAEGYVVAEIAQVKPVVITPLVVSAAATADVHLSDIPHNTTLVLQLKTGGALAALKTDDDHLTKFNSKPHIFFMMADGAVPALPACCACLTVAAVGWQTWARTTSASVTH